MSREAMALGVPPATAGDFLELLWDAADLHELRLEPDAALAHIRAALAAGDLPGAQALLAAELAIVGPVLTHGRYLSPEERAGFVDLGLMARYAAELQGLAGLASARAGRLRAARGHWLSGLAARPDDEALRGALRALADGGLPDLDPPPGPPPDEAAQAQADQAQIQADLGAAGADSLGVLVLKTEVGRVVGYATRTLILPLDLLTAALGAGGQLPAEALALGTQAALRLLLPAGPSLAAAEGLLTLARSMRTYQDPIGATDAVVLALRMLQHIGHARGEARAWLDLGVNLKDLVLLYDALRALDLADARFEALGDGGGLAAGAFHRATVCRRLQEGTAALGFVRDARRRMPPVDAARGWIRQLRLEELQIAMDLDRRADARRCIDEWLAAEPITGDAPDGRSPSLLLNARGTLAGRDGDLPSALEDLGAAAVWAAREILEHRTVRYRDRERQNREPVFATATQVALLAGEADLAFGLLQLARTGALHLSARPPGGAEPASAELQAQQAALVPRAVAALGQDEAARAALQQELEWLLGRHDFLRGPAGAGAGVAAGRSGVEALAHAVRARLGPQELLLEYAWVGDTLVLLALDRGASTAHRLEPAREALLGQVAAVAEELRAGVATTALEALAPVLLGPVAARLAAASTVFVVPAEGLHDLPFHALAPGGEPLVETHVVRWLDRAADLAEPRPAPPAAAGCRVLGVAEAAYSGLPALAGVAVELSGVVARWPGAVPTAAATAADLFGAGDAALVHIACHAESEPQAPLLSRLLFADRPVFAFEIALARFAAGLVVLSACDTASGPAARGGRTASLASAFLGAGAQAVAATLWPLDDEVATLFVDRFHAALQAPGVSAAQAARIAQRAVRARPEFRHPYFWAPFVVHG